MRRTFALVRYRQLVRGGEVRVDRLRLGGGVGTRGGRLNERMSRPLVWFRRDLRTHDNAALHGASMTATRGVVGAYVICSEMWRKHDDASIKIDFWLRNLRELSTALARLHIPLLVVRAEGTKQIGDCLLAVARAAHCDSLVYNHEYEVNERRRDEVVARRLESEGLRVSGFHDRVIFAPGSIRTDEGRFYSVFTPFKRRALQRLKEQSVELLPEPKCQSPIEVQATSIPARIEGWDVPADADQWPAGERAAIDRLRVFVESSIVTYSRDRDAPAIDGTSSLSPYLAAGVLSPRQCFVTACRANGGRYEEHNAGNGGAAQWISELIWREFYQHILVGFPRVSMHRAFKPSTNHIRWNENADHFARSRA